MAAPRVPFPYRDDREFIQAIKTAGGIRPLSEMLKMSHHTVRRWARERQVNPDAIQAELAAPPLEVDHEITWLTKALKKLGDHASIEQLADHCNVPPRTIRAGLGELREQGYRLVEQDGQVDLDRNPSPSHLTHHLGTDIFDGDEIRVGIVSDTHICSVEDKIDELHVAYDMFVEQGIREVWHIGDLVAGNQIYPHQVKDLRIVAFEQQVQEALDVYPVRPGIQTKMISGNHDLEGAVGRVGADPVQAFCNKREDVEYLGQYSAWLELPQGTRIHLVHPMGGGSYAISYKCQKFAEAYEGGKKPGATIMGHYHSRGNFRWRSIEMLLAGCFEGQTDLARRKALGEPAVGFHILTIRVSDDGSIVRWMPEWFAFYRGKLLS